MQKESNLERIRCLRDESAPILGPTNEPNNQNGSVSQIQLSFLKQS